MSPAPLPVPLRLCLGRPCLLMLLMQLVIHRGRELCSSGLAGPTTTSGLTGPTTTSGLAGPTTTIAHATTTSQLDELLQGFSDLQDPHPGSHLSDRIGPSRTTTRVDPDRWLRLYQPPQHRLLRLLLHQPPRYLRAPLLSLR